MKLRDKNVTIVSGKEKLQMCAYEFTHALICMGEKPMSFGTMYGDSFNSKLKKAFKGLNYSPSEFTSNPTIAKIGSEEIEFPAINKEKVVEILQKLSNFAKMAGKKEICW